MSLNLQNTAGNGLFDIQGRAYASMASLDTARKTTIPAKVQAVLDALNLVTPVPISYEQAGSPIPNALTGWQSGGNALNSTLATFTQNLLAAFVAEDASLVDTTITAALDYLLTQMEAGQFYVTPSVVGATLTPGGSNAGDTVVAWSLARGDGKRQQNAYAETITLTVGANPSTTRPSITCVGEAKVDLLSQDWPAGSGVSRTLTATDPANSLLSNGNFETATYANVPDGWIVAVGAPGTKVLLTAPEQQTVAIGGTPTGGSYILKYTDRNSRVWATAAIAWNATAGTVQSALRAIPDMAGCTVSATGTSPDFTHTVIFTGTGGNVAQLTSLNLMTGGSPAITHATTVGGDAGDYRGRALKLVGDSSTLQALYHPLSTSMSLGSVYFAHLRLLRAGTATGAVVKVAMVQEIGGAAMADDEGTTLELTIDAAALSDSAYESNWFSFRLPATAVLPVYLRVAVTTAIPTGGNVLIDEVAVAAGTELYNGGPFVAAFSGRDASREGDYWSFAVSNSRASVWNTAYNRAFQMAEKGLLLPTSGVSLIADNMELYPA